MLGLIFAGIYFLVNLACIGYFLRERRDEFNVIKHLIVPIIGAIAMIPAALAVIGGVTIPILDITLDPYETALKWCAPIVGVWLVLGVIAYFVLRMRNPEALDRVGEVYGGESDAVGSSAPGSSAPGSARRRIPPATDRCGPAATPARSTGYSTSIFSWLGGGGSGGSAGAADSSSPAIHRSR